ncbi:hypothetical protein [Desulfosarcina sp. BuS5]|uniref:hypothetical protein n=1 Tax=Desulfosarcina sp. BuS5 TaxID=933262 RepID=UPI00047F9617|nr:hypothetical protein [Desulfosarcina sp. BuS5]
MNKKINQEEKIIVCGGLYFSAYIYFVQKTGLNRGDITLKNKQFLCALCVLCGEKTGSNMEKKS